jgi:8-oxo-dGTP pyrophosphatase MutT (NUDIX family)
MKKKLLPLSAHKVFSGKLFSVYQWDQKQFDGSMSLFEKAELRPAVFVFAVTKENKLLLLREEQPGSLPYTSLPAGGKEENETEEEAVKRELLEETGYQAESYEKFDEYFGSSKVIFHQTVFIAKGVKKVQEPCCEPGEKIEVFEISFDEFFDFFRKKDFHCPFPLKFFLYECLLSPIKKKNFLDSLRVSA